MRAHIAAVVGTHVHQECAASVEEFGDLAFVDARPNWHAELPSRSVVIRVDRMRSREMLLLSRIVVVVVAGNHQPAFVRTILDLNPDAWPGGVPRPGGILRARGN